MATDAAITLNLPSILPMKPTLPMATMEPASLEMLEDSHKSIPLIILLIITDIVAFLGNVLVILAFIFYRKLRHTDFNLFILNLAVTDVMVAVIGIPFFTVDYIRDSNWMFGKWVCGFWIFFDWGMTFASINTLMVISLNRLWAARWSAHFRRHNSRRKTIIIIILSW